LKDIYVDNDVSAYAGGSMFSSVGNDCAPGNTTDFYSYKGYTNKHQSRINSYSDGYGKYLASQQISVDFDSITIISTTYGSSENKTYKLNENLNGLSISPNQVFSLNFILRDAFGNKATSIGTSIPVNIYSSGDNSQIVAYNKLQEYSFNGTITFSNLQIAGIVGTNATIKTLSGLLEANFPILIKDCDVGYGKSNTSIQSCTYCSEGKYSIKNESYCRTCPSHSTCPGGSSVISDNNYWTLFNYSTGEALSVYCQNGKCTGNNQCSDSGVDTNQILCGAC
jgi:hypothetical protein